MRSKKAIINIISSVLLQVGTIICGFIVPKLIISNYGSSVNGLVTSITQFLAYITLLEAGFGPVVKSILYKPIASKDKKQIEGILKASEKFFRTISYIFIAYIAILCIVLPMILSNEFDKLFTLSLVLIISISTFAEYYFGITYRLYLQAEQKTYIISIIQITTLIMNTIVIVALVYSGASIQIVKLASAIVFILRPILQNLYVKKKYNINISNAKFDYVIKQKWDGLAQHIASVVHENTDIVVLSLFTNMIEVSVYSVYILIINGVKSLVQAFIGGIDASFGDMIAKKEKENLNNSFKIYEEFYFNITTIVGTAALLLIVPFVSIYTAGITDANYIRPVFAYLIVLAEFMWMIRLPYSGIVYAAGHFKETKKGAWIEAISNIIISVILVWKFGIVGVAIGTLFAMTIRTIEFMYHTTKYILNRSMVYTFKRLLIIALQVIAITLIVNKIPSVEVTSYLTWTYQAIIITLISAVVVLTSNYIIYRDNFKGVFELIKNSLKRANKQNITKK